MKPYNRSKIIVVCCFIRFSKIKRNEEKAEVKLKTQICTKKSFIFWGRVTLILQSLGFKEISKVVGTMNLVFILKMAWPGKESIQSHFLIIPTWCVFFHLLHY